MRGIEALLEILAAARVRYIFGNPGSTELPLSDALAQDDRFQYILNLHELPLAAMADGYALASGELGVACVHICGGLGNAMGMLYNAWREGAPLLLLAGQQDRRFRIEEPALEGDMVSVTRPWTKWSAEIGRVEDVATATRRAIQVALTPPTGPVFLSLPVDVQLEHAAAFDLTPPHIPDRRVRPPVEALEEAARLLAQARNPAILAGSRVVEADAIAELAALAEHLAAPVFSEMHTTHGRVPMPADHPLYAGSLPVWAPEIRQRLSDFDVILVVGMALFRQFIYRGAERPIPETARLIQLDNNPWELGKNYPVDVALLGDPKAGLAELAQRVAAIYPADQKEAAGRRRAAHAGRRADEQAALLAEIAGQQDRRPMTPLTLMHALARALPPNAAVVSEAATTHNSVLERLGVLRDPTGHFAHRGWVLGWGLGCAIGVKLAWPERPVVALLGDGAALYGIQGLWTAAHHHIPVTFLIANNAQYKVLKSSAGVLSLTRVAHADYRGMDLTDPAVDFAGLARAFGVEAQRVTEPDALCEQLAASLTRTGPLLLEAPIAR
jgi:benzoylformate decarboxylase